MTITRRPGGLGEIETHGNAIQKKQKKTRSKGHRTFEEGLKRLFKRERGERNTGGDWEKQPLFK